MYTVHVMPDLSGVMMSWHYLLKGGFQYQGDPPNRYVAIQL